VVTVPSVSVAEKVILVAPSSATVFVLSTVRVSASLTSLPVTSITFAATDTDGTVATTATAANGTVEVKGDGTISYPPAADYNGKDTITVTALNFNRSVRCRRCCYDGSINIAGFKANARCTIFSHRFCTVYGECGGIINDGTVEVKGDGTISYTPAADYNGTDTITVTVTDNDGLTTIKSSSITVNDVNDAPTLTVDSTKTVA
jgi:hypothetical protein